MKIYYKEFMLFIILIFPFGHLLSQSKLTADEILDKVDQNMVSTSVISEAKMIIHNKDRIDTKIMKSWGVGKKKGFTEFTAPSRDKGTKYLRVDDNLWMYLPSVEKVIKLSGHLLRQSMMGSDFSYEDALDRLKLRDDYSVEIIGDEEYNGEQCYVLELTATHKEVTYYRRKIWVDKKKFIGIKSELYAKTGKLLKEMTVQKVEEFDGRYYPVHSTMENKLRKNSKTEFIVTSIEFDADIPESVFSRRNLEKR